MLCTFASRSRSSVKVKVICEGQGHHLRPRSYVLLGRYGRNVDKEIGFFSGIKLSVQGQGHPSTSRSLVKVKVVCMS